MASLPPIHAAFGTYAPSQMVGLTIGRTRRGGTSWAAKRVVFALRKWAIGRLKGRPVDTEVLGARMRLMPQNNVCEKRILFTPQYFDPRERELIRPYLTPGSVFLDIGANVGGYALWAAAHAEPGARIIAVEPDPVLFDRLSYNIAINPTGSVKAVCTAISDSEGPLMLFFDSRNRGGASVKIAKDASDGGERIMVHAITLAELVAQERLQHIDVLKLDVEGTEDMILSPFLAVADVQCLPKLIVLNHLRQSWSDDLMGMLQAKGYRLVEKTSANYVLERPLNA